MNSDIAQMRADLQARAKRFDFCDLELSTPARKELDNIIDRLTRFVRSRKGNQDVSVLKTRVLLCEVHDYFGAFSEAASLGAPGAEVLVALPRAISSEEEYSEGLSKVRLAIAYSRTLYRSYDFSAAHQLLKLCESYVHQLLRSHQHACFGVLGEVAYLRGRIWRQQQRLQYAVADFNSAVDLYDQRARFKRRTAAPDADVDAQFSATKCGIILALGTAWSNFASGSLSRALSENLIPARAILARSKDTLNKAYADVIFASVARAYADDPSALEETRDLVQGALRTFEAYGHRFYSDGARMELALLSIARKETQEAEEVIKRVDFTDKRWACSANIVRSRIARQRIDESASQGESPNQELADSAVKYASEALDAAKRQDEPLGMIDALVAHSEALYVQKPTEARFECAVGDLRQALKLNRVQGARSPRVDGMCHLQLARHFLLHGQQHIAIKHFSMWRAVASRVEHRSLHHVAAVIAKNLNVDKFFVVDAAKGNLRYPDHKRALQQFLLRQVSAQSITESEKARRLGITRQGLAKWMKVDRSDG